MRKRGSGVLGDRLEILPPVGTELGTLVLSWSHSLGRWPRPRLSLAYPWVLSSLGTNDREEVESLRKAGKRTTSFFILGV